MDCSFCTDGRWARNSSLERASLNYKITQVATDFFRFSEQERRRVPSSDDCRRQLRTQDSGRPKLSDASLANHRRILPCSIRVITFVTHSKTSSSSFGP